jgi:hypothetical protein
MNAPSTTGNSKLVLLGAPSHVRSRAIDTKEYKRRLPHDLACLGILGLLPDICVPVLGGCNNPVGIGSPVDRCDDLVVLSDRVL